MTIIMIKMIMASPVRQATVLFDMDSKSDASPRLVDLAILADPIEDLTCHSLVHDHENHFFLWLDGHRKLMAGFMLASPAGIDDRSPQCACFFGRFHNRFSFTFVNHNPDSLFHEGFPSVRILYGRHLADG